MSRLRPDVAVIRAWKPQREVHLRAAAVCAVYEAPHATAPDLGGAVDALLALPSGT